MRTYVLANRVDDRPTTIFDLRGVPIPGASRQQELAWRFGVAAARSVGLGRDRLVLASYSHGQIRALESATCIVPLKNRKSNPKSKSNSIVGFANQI